MVLFEGRYLRVISREGWEYVERVHSHEAVVIVALTKKKEVILIEQYRVPSSATVVEFPAGILNDPEAVSGESKEEAAKRELHEEAGYESKKWKLLLEGPPSPGLSNEMVLFYAAYDAKKTGPGGGVGSEKIITHAVPLQKVDGWLKKMESQGRLVDPKVYVGLYFLKSKKA